MLTGKRELITDALGLDIGFETKTAARRFSESPIWLHSAVLLEGLYERIVRNWDGSACPSTQLWRAAANSKMSANNVSPEKTLEKAIANSVSGWLNQIPAASGLLRGIEERLRNVDLGHFVEPGHLELIELKAGLRSDTPLKAAFEVVGCGLLYRFAREHRLPLALATENRILEARRVDLKVLAPREVYKGYCLKWLGTSLNAGFQGFSRRHCNFALEMNFRFEVFADDFQWPGSPEDSLPGFLKRRTPQVWH